MLDILLQSSIADRLGTWTIPVLLVLIIATCAAAAYVLEKIVIAMMRGWAKRTKVQIDDVIVNAAHPALLMIVFLAGLVLALRLIPLGLSPFTTTVLQNVGRTLAIIAVGIAIIKLITGLLKLPAKKNPRWSPLSTVGSRLIGAALWAMVFLTVLHQYGIEITPMLAGLGVGAIAVGLALQSTLANFFAGLWIQAGENLRPGHFIRLEEHKLDGFIEEVGWRSTRVRSLPGNMVIVPNERLSQSIITNFSLPEEKMGTSIKLTVGFETDTDRVVEILLEEVHALTKEYDYILTDPAPNARLNGAVEHGWEFWCGFWIAHYWDQWNAQGQMFRRVRARFLKEGIRLALPIHEEFMVPPERSDVRQSIIAVRQSSNGNGHASARPPRAPAYPPPETEDATT